MKDTVRMVLEKCQFESGGRTQSERRWFCNGRVVLHVRQFVVIRMLQRFCLQPDEQGRRCRLGRTVHNSFSQFCMLLI